jgi:hypothetical protein
MDIAFVMIWRTLQTQYSIKKKIKYSVNGQLIDYVLVYTGERMYEMRFADNHDYYSRDYVFKPC